MSDSKVFWSTAALAMLGQRDRYSREIILQEFTKRLNGPEGERGQPLFGNPKEHKFSTSVLDDNSRVIWELDPGGNRVEVLAVVERNPPNREAFNHLIELESRSPTAAP